MLLDFINQNLNNCTFILCLGLSLNEEGTKLISCVSDLKLIIMEVSNKQNWIVKQIIQKSLKGFRINFITNDIFIF
ncbi:unnamed protein product [Paramecium primaurelia]|uniref:Uncharacterized protein n=1 Tax=Paramecium primaurelia TaxID=5886 RepID=A0A8S1NUW0_PARPR|nr:unnamed protein product [Paramecium primaurelia]